MSRARDSRAPGARRSWIVATGAVTSLGRGVEALWEGLLEGRSGIRPSPWGAPVAALAPAPEIPSPERLWPDREGEIAGPEAGRNLLLLTEVLAQVLIDSVEGERALAGASPVRRGFYAAMRRRSDAGQIASGTGSEDLEGTGPELTVIARRLALAGPLLMLHDACATGTALLGEAAADLQAGRCDRAVVAAANADLSLETLCHYAIVGALSSRPAPDACLPFDRRRDGFVRGEGAACVLLSTERPPGPAPAVEVIGYGSSADAHSVTAGHPEQRGLVLAIGRCLADAGLDPSRVDHINAHGTGTRGGDQHESLALRRVFGERLERIPLTAIKATTGHASFASGLIEAVVAAETLARRTLPPYLAALEPDPGLPRLDPVIAAPRPFAGRTVLTTSSAFGGLNAALLLRADSWPG